jgi:hypothetical protein
MSLLMGAGAQGQIVLVLQNLSRSRFQYFWSRSCASSATPVLRSRAQASQELVLRRVAERPELALKVIDCARREGIRHTHELVRKTLTDESGGATAQLAS